MSSTSITLIGAGNMGTSLLGGLINHGYHAETIWVSDPDPQKLSQLQKQFHVHITTSNQEAIQSSDVIILAVKPQVLKTVAVEMREHFNHQKPLIVSIAAGIRLQSLQEWLGESLPIVRVMPNTPALIGCGASALYANQFVSTQQKELAESILQAVGISVWLDAESQMDTVTALSGSGPAYFFLIIEALQDAAIKLGLPAEIARVLTLQTAYGASRMALDNPADVISLRHQVTSPGGTTESALQLLEKENIRETLLKTLQAAQNKSIELATQFAKETEK